jgi:hypothetical protein
MTGIRSWLWLIGAIVHNTAAINPGLLWLVGKYGASRAICSSVSQ